ncbi:grb2-associated binder, gab [Anopheles darlingi]|uniref:Grb2-associated binder, gab n=1 Tax=Anopheles darlingi TaxID=43151 RepID=W5JVY8_ANODA|nr:grb2-associated binder, gab [Anopheles darlingi]
MATAPFLRWRRRWFTLKQSDVPGQFFLEYYTDRNCRKLKGTIDLDQCEQVDAGLRLDREKEKYAHMFDVKTPTRTYYLAAETEDDMRGWVNCICQVCNLQETQSVNDRPYYNIGAINMNEAVNMAVETRAPVKSNAGPGTNTTETDVSNETETTILNHSMVVASGAAEQQQQQQQQQHSRSYSNNPYGTYQNEEMMGLRSTTNGEYSNRETIICEAKLHTQQHAAAEAYSNLDVIIERSQSLRGKPNGHAGASAASAGGANHAATGSGTLVNHMRTQSLNIEQRGTRKIPENLKLTERSPSTSAFDSGPEQPSPALSTSSGPYIPISECYSGSPVTPLNSLDPRFYETPRSHTNVGFNLNVSNEQPYSPKRSNVGQQTGAGPSSLAMARAPGVVSGSGKSSPSDSESVFTDDEWTAPVVNGGATVGASSGSGVMIRGTSNGVSTIDRNTRPSDSSIENDAVGWTYVQRFSKVPNAPEDKQPQQSQQQQQQQQQQTKGVSSGGNGTTIKAAASAPPRPPKRASMNLDGIEKSKDFISSDTENVSPAIMGPKDASSCIEEFYDIPRSHQHPYTGSSMHLDGDLLSPLSHCDLVASSTPNLISEFGGSVCGTLGRNPRPHCYTNAAPTKVEGNVFRFDFSEQPDAPAINRRLKPRGCSSMDITKSIESITQGVKQLGSSSQASNVPPATPGATGPSQAVAPMAKSPPTIDRTRKPATPNIGSLRRKGGPVVSLNLASGQSTESTYGNTTQHDMSSQVQLVSISPRAPPGKNEDRLQYLDLDHSNSPQKNHGNSNNGSGSGGVMTHGNDAKSSASGKQNDAGSGVGVHTHNTGSGAGASASAGGSTRSLEIPKAPVPLLSNRTPYTTVDFVKTDAFNRIRADSELTRSQQPRQKDPST